MAPRSTAPAMVSTRHPAFISEPPLPCRRWWPRNVRTAGPSVGCWFDRYSIALLDPTGCLPSALVAVPLLKFGNVSEGLGGLRNPRGSGTARLVSATRRNDARRHGQFTVARRRRPSGRQGRGPYCHWHWVRLAFRSAAVAAWRCVAKHDRPSVTRGLCVPSAKVRGTLRA